MTKEKLQELVLEIMKQGGSIVIASIVMYFLFTNIIPRYQEEIKEARKDYMEELIRRDDLLERQVDRVLKAIEDLKEDIV